ncbi:uncharacterized protein LOC129911953 [Episyrphus balteatus]|uniref:uncharacterized protein LOC129911953 n=1 Tax=Episyrphus balteatus TaxID=286459 RepID=UPI002485617E|nr:uncharacterized protein LOC129911953 [Episyrphus balteatus]
MKITLLLFAILVASLAGLVPARDIPVNPKDPSLEYEIINPQSVPQPKKPIIGDSTQSNQNKTFTYDPITKQWAVIKPSDEITEGTLIWNQNNDKWLTQSFIP